MQLVYASRRRLGFAAIGAMAASALLIALLIGPASSSAAACPSFRVLHNDRIGPAVLPGGPYNVTPAPGSGLTCAASSKLFTRFLEDYDGVLPGGWRVVAEGKGRASFKRGGATGFFVARIGGGGGEGEEEGNNRLGTLCGGTYTVNTSTNVGPLFFRQGAYLIYKPPGSNMPCRRASGLFTKFLAQPGGRLPFPWRLTNQTATFYKPEHPVRSAFRIEPANGAGVR